MGALIALIVQELPALLPEIKDLFHKANPNDPIPTDEQVHQAFLAAIAVTLSKDDSWLASHPATDVNGNPIP
jgi:hypothetical protein